MRVMDYLLRSIRDAALFNPEVQAAPHCILGPDRDHQWEPAVQRLLQEMPELFILGEYNPEKRTGPAIWLKCVVHLFGDRDNQKCDTPVSGYLVEKITVSQESFVPIIYLPGVSRQDLRAVEACPDNLKPLAELQQHFPPVPVPPVRTTRAMTAGYLRDLDREASGGTMRCPLMAR